ncbi:signal peptidase complex subunit 3 [Nematocida minor]|uniref:signal peptidase complex subunit 3 n=1 Tax=Nematocida minor TaxID=1912983 RepID=UPI0022204FEF|nr:signal peptidase complex subunit 3 [Nematocida minor]KAI5190954.1 signal peptidase complex subunit 3 [Nematocida minor]
MNTSSKRLSKALSLISSYLTVLVIAISISSFLMNREKGNCRPVLHSATASSIVFTPNLDLTSKMNYNVKEAYIYLVHKTNVKGIDVEKVVWSTLAKTSKTYTLNHREFGSSDDYTRPLFQGSFHLKGTYFPYIGFIKNVTFAEFSSLRS